MLDPLVLAPIGIGVVLLFAGATLSKYGVALMGAVLGAGAGYLAAPSLASAVGAGTLTVALGGIAVGIVLGVVLAHVLLSVAVAAIGFGVGTYLGLTVLAPVLVDGAWYVEAGAGIAIGLAVAATAMVFTYLVMVLLTSFVGAALASRSVTADHIAEAQETTSLGPILFDAGDPVFLGLLVVGMGLQVGLLQLGYARRIVSFLPGAGMLRNRRDPETSG